MNVITIQKIQQSIGIRDLLAVENLQVQEGQRIGLVGKNGSGKSTLFNILSGREKADVGEFSVNGTIELLPQLKKVMSRRVVVRFHKSILSGFWPSLHVFF